MNQKYRAGARGGWGRVQTGEVVGHGVVLGVVLELLRDDGVTEEELERGEDVLARGRKGRGGREVLVRLVFGSCLSSRITRNAHV